MKAFGLRTWLLLIALGLSFSAAIHADVLDDARSLMRQGRHDDAIARLDRHLQSAPDDSTARFLKGVALAESGRQQGAIEIFSALVREFPELPEPHNNLAVLHAARGELEKARSYLLEAIRLHPSYATAHENLGDVYGKMAALSYSKASSLDGANRSARAKHALVEQLGGTRGGISTASAPAPAQPPPAPVVAAAPMPSADIENEVMSTLRRWAEAWSRQDVEDYLEHYADAFVPADGRSRESWTILRRKRVSGPQFIELRIGQPRVSRISEDQASVIFEQSYRSDSYADQVVKRLDLVRQRSGWKILAERTVE